MWYPEISPPFFTERNLVPKVPWLGVKVAKSIHLGCHLKNEYSWYWLRCSLQGTKNFLFTASYKKNSWVHDDDNYKSRRVTQWLYWISMVTSDTVVVPCDARILTENAKVTCSFSSSEATHVVTWPYISYTCCHSDYTPCCISSNTTQVLCSTAHVLCCVLLDRRYNCCISANVPMLCLDQIAL